MGALLRCQKLRPRFSAKLVGSGWQRASQHGADFVGVAAVPASAHREMRVAAALSAALAAQELALFFEQPRTHAARAELARTLPVCGWVLSEAQEASCEGSDDAACDDERHGPPVVRLLGADGSSRGFETTLTASAGRSRTVNTAAARRLLRVRAPESAMPGLNWAVGLDALRVLEWADEERLDWLLSVQAAGLGAGLG